MTNSIRVFFIVLRQLRRADGEKRARGQLWKHLGKAGEADTMADLPPHSSLDMLSADDVLTPGAHNPAIALASKGRVHSRDACFGTGDKRTRVTDQLATAVDLGTADWAYGWGWHTVRTS
jgi:hypothetical protein